MHRISTEIKVGLFALVGLGIIIWMAREVENVPVRGVDGRILYAYFPTVSGVLKKTPVEVAGIPVGYVKEIALDGTRPKLTLFVDTAVKVYEDTRVIIQKRGLLGERIITLMGGGTAPEIPPGGTLRPGEESYDMEQAMEAVGSLVQSVKEIVDGNGQPGAPSLKTIIQNVSGVSDDLKVIMKRNAENINEILDNIASFSGDLREFGEVSGGSLNELVANFQELSAALNDAVRTAAPDLKSSAREVREFTEKLNRTVERVESIVAKIERGEGTIGRLINDEKTVDNLNTALEGINDFVGSTNRIQTAIGYRGEYLADSRTVQSFVSLYIRPRKDKYFLIEVIDMPIGPKRYDREERITDTDGVISTRVRQRRSSSLAFSLQLAKRFYDVTARFGVFRNTAGLGVDFHLFRDHLMLTAEASAFGRTDRFQLRLAATLFLWRVLFVTGGVNDLIHRDGVRDYFGGAGLQFTDEDIKTLFTAVSLGSLR